MKETRSLAWLLLLVPLVGLAGWLLHHSTRTEPPAFSPLPRSSGERPALPSSWGPAAATGVAGAASTPPGPTSSGTAVAPSGSEAGPDARGFPPPRADYPADRLYERVDGAAELLRAAGCRRLLYWRIEHPPADLEVLAFATAEGARTMLARDAGADRTPGAPGDEGWASPQAVYFRHGAIFVRLIADEAAPVGSLLDEARRVERALGSGDLKP